MRVILLIFWCVELLVCLYVAPLLALLYVILSVVVMLTWSDILTVCRRVWSLEILGVYSWGVALLYCGYRVHFYWFPQEGRELEAYCYPYFPSTLSQFLTFCHSK